MCVFLCACARVCVCVCVYRGEVVDVEVVEVVGRVFVGGSLPEGCWKVAWKNERVGGSYLGNWAVAWRMGKEGGGLERRLLIDRAWGVPLWGWGWRTLDGSRCGGGITRVGR